uniref:Uncharacterized protein n=1 Tax=Anguilla anguilla TaxID=7936 RepID=A0A0E9WGE6_ANGAN
MNLSGVDYKCLKLKVRFQTSYILVCFSKCLSRVDLSSRIMNLFGKMEQTLKMFLFIKLPFFCKGSGEDKAKQQDAYN